jgi:N-acylglucosamine 2-epimerase
MNAVDFASQYRTELFENVIPFWEKHSIDEQNGGYFTFLDRKGGVFGTDKYVWLQGRQAWMFAYLFNHYEKRTQWLEIAEGGAEFLRKHGRGDDGAWHFALSRSGAPLGKPYNIFSDCFAAMAFSELAQATANEDDRRIAEDAYLGVLDRLPDPASRAADGPEVSESEPLTIMALPMILANLTMELSWMFDEAFVRQTTRRCLDQLFDVYLDPKREVLRERLRPDGSVQDSPNGRMVIPGHGIEAMWFAMEIGERFGDEALIERATDVVLSTLDFGWDRKRGGIFYFLDIEDQPVQELEWDQKLWWVHLETLVALAMSSRLTGQLVCKNWYERVHNYTWARFPDPTYGEWWGYLNRRGKVSIHSKGGKWKGCFHVPRALYVCYRQFEALGEEEAV